MIFRTKIAIIVLPFLVAACSTGPAGVRIVNGGTSAYSAKEGAKIRDFGGAEITSSVSGKTFQYTRKDAVGMVTYNPDGSLDILDDKKGEMRGSWSIQDGQYCETYGPDMAQECGTFKYTGDAYFAANSRLVEMKI